MRREDILRALMKKLDDELTHKGNLVSKKILELVHRDFKTILVIRSYTDYVKKHSRGPLDQEEMNKELTKVEETLLMMAEVNNKDFIDNTIAYVEEIGVELPDFDKMQKAVDNMNLKTLINEALKFEPFNKFEKGKKKDAIVLEVHKLLAAAGRYMINRQLKENYRYSELTSKTLEKMRTFVAGELWTIAHMEDLVKELNSNGEL